MQVLIHTSGRAHWHRQHTLRALLEAGVKVELVIQAAQQEDYYRMLKVQYMLDSVTLHVLPPHITTLAATRDWIIHEMNGTDHVVFMDDDLHFAARREDDRTKFRQPQAYDLTNMLEAIDYQLKHFPMVGICSREGGNRVTEEFSQNTRIMRVLAFRRSYLRKHQITFSPLVVMEDFHVNLQILRSGADTLVLNNWVSNQAGGSDAPGGCSVYRTDKVQTDSAHLLAARHPGFVKVVQKTTKTAWGGKTRTDVVVQWKQAAAAGKRSNL